MSKTNPQVSIETSADKAAIYHLNCQAFPSDAEAKLVQSIQHQLDDYISLVAKIDKQIVGHIMLSPMSIKNHADYKALLYGLAPMAVIPAHQKKGIGQALITAAIEACRQKDAAAIFVLGHPSYYPKFGFVKADDFSIKCQYDIPKEAFMVLPFKTAIIKLLEGDTVLYDKVFDAL